MAPARLAPPRLRLLAPTSLGRAEMAIATVLLTALAAAVFGDHVRQGGFHWDDWENAATTRYPPAGFLGPVDLRTFAYRPVLALALALPHEAFGLRPALHLALAVALAVAVSACLYALLRELRLERLHAGAIAALALLFPWSDSTRLWATGGINNLAIALYLLGTVLALRGLTASGARRARRLEVAAVALYVLSVLTYEAAAFAALVTGLFLYPRRAPRTRALRRWRTDAAAVGAAIALVAAATTRDVQPPAGVLRHAGAIAVEAVEVLARAALPVGSSSAVPALAALAGLVAVAGGASVIARRRPPGDPVRGELRRWLLAAGAAAAVIAAGYAMFVPGEPRYTPLAGGVGNRVNILAALGFAALLYAFAALAATVVFGRRRAAAAGAAAAATVALAVGWIAVLRADAARWQRASAVQERVLAAIERGLPRPPARGTAVYAVGAPPFTAPGIPAFATSWDLNSAVKLRLGDPSARAVPLRSGTDLRCGSRSIAPAASYNVRAQVASYGRTFVVDVREGLARPIRAPIDCRAARARPAAMRTAGRPPRRSGR